MVDETREGKPPGYSEPELDLYTETQAFEKVHFSKTMPIRRKLEIQIAMKEKELAELKAAKEALDNNPEYEKLHDTLARVSRFL